LEQSAPLGTRTRLLLQGGSVPFRLSPFEVITLLVVLGAAMFGGYEAYAKMTDLNAPVAAPPTFIPAFRQNLTTSVSTTGTVVSSQQVTLTFGTTGKIKEFLVGLGAQVKAGQPLARIDDTDLQQAVKSAQSNLDSAVARLNAATQGPQTTDILSAQQAINTAKSQLATAQQNLADLKAKPLPSDLAKAQQGVLTAQNALQTANDAIAKANTDLTNAQSDLGIAQNNLQNDVIQAGAAFDALAALPGVASNCSLPPRPTGAGAQTALPTCTAAGVDSAKYQAAASNYNSLASKVNTDVSTVAAKQTALVNAQNAANSPNLQRNVQNAQLGLQVAQQTLADTQAGAKQSDLDAAQRAIDAAQSSLDTAQAKYDALFQPAKPETVLPLQASVDQAKAQLSSAQQNLAAATIVAPFDGQISSLSGEVGSQVSANTAVFILLNPRLIRVDANVDQSDISNLKVGQNATITFDALTGRAYQGTVSAIGLTPTTTQGVVTYVVTFAIDTSQLPATTPIPAPGMTGSISVLTSSTPNALVIPTRAIKRSGRTATVTVKTATGTEERQITTGAVSGNLTQVTAGLADGDAVLVNIGTTAAATTTNTTNRTTNPFGGGGGQFTIPGR
jgi:multidrug efflux pump subunit AcrA (membrane-fusion protein)